MGVKNQSSGEKSLYFWDDYLSTNDNLYFRQHILVDVLSMTLSNIFNGKFVALWPELVRNSANVSLGHFWKTRKNDFTGFIKIKLLSYCHDF